METIGRYEIIKDLGQGGMAMVYLARDPAMDRQVAIKVLPRQFTFDPQFRARFHREAKTIAALEHPAIVPVYDYGEHEEQPYIVMRYMNGGSLADRIRQSPLEMGDIADLFRRIAPALDVSHQRGMIHRDLKPGNILYDEWGGAYLSDFGIVKITEATAAFTGTTIVGTPAYMSPEQASGKGPIDGRSDIYSLAVILYELLTRQLPYKADTPMGLAMAHIIDPIPSILDTNPGLPPVSETIIRRALAKKPDDRYPNAVTFANAIFELASSSSSTPVPTFAGLSHSGAIAITPPPGRPPTGSRPASQPGRPPTGSRASQPGMGGGGGPAVSQSAVASSPLIPATGARAAAMPSMALRRLPFFGAAGILLALGMALTCVGGYVLAAFVLTTPTPTATATFTATFTSTATTTSTNTATPTDTATTAPTDTPEVTPGTTRVFIPFTATPVVQAPVCSPPEVFDAALNRCRVPEQNNSGSSGGGSSGGSAGGGNNNGGGGNSGGGNPPPTNPPPPPPTNPPPPPPTNPPPPPPTNPPPPPPTNPPPPPPTNPPPPPPTEPPPPPEPTDWIPPCVPQCQIP